MASLAIDGEMLNVSPDACNYTSRELEVIISLSEMNFTAPQIEQVLQLLEEMRIQNL